MTLLSDLYGGAGGGMSNMVEDTTPQLGGDLDMNGHNVGGNTETQLDDAVSKKHAAGSDTDLDSTFEATFVKKADTVNVLSDITSSGADIEDAVTKKHAATLIGTKTIDETDIGNEKVIAYNSTSGNLEYETAGVGGGLDNIVEDTTPQLGGNLDMNGHSIGGNTEAQLDDAVSKKHAATLIGTKTIDETDIGHSRVIAYNISTGHLEYEAAGGGNVNTSGSPIDNDFAKFTDGTHIEGRSYSEVRADLGIEAGADVTDTANVTSAGALMDSEVDADIKTFALPANTTISTAGKALIDDASASVQRTTLGLGSAATRSAEDSMTDGANLPDGHAIKTYGDSNWGGGSVAGSDTQVQFNDGGSFGGDSGMTFTKATNVLKVAGKIWDGTTATIYNEESYLPAQKFSQVIGTSGSPDSTGKVVVHAEKFTSKNAGATVGEAVATFSISKKSGSSWASGVRGEGCAHDGTGEIHGVIGAVVSYKAGSGADGLGIYGLAGVTNDFAGRSSYNIGIEADVGSFVYGATRQYNLNCPLSAGFMAINRSSTHPLNYGYCVGVGQWHTGFMVIADTITPNYEAIYINGGSSAAKDYSGIVMGGYILNGIDMSGATIAGVAISIPESVQITLNGKNAMYSNGVNLVLGGGFTTVYASADIYATGSISAAGGCCADYVFESKYNLMELDDLQTFTKNTHCLPNMTINDTDKVDLVISVNELLVKTEEQALYILQLHKRLKVLELKKRLTRRSKYAIL